ncbi:ABC transporter component [Actinomyces sp. Chiba101]|uniref:ABC transporter ATP-binding protein n=1 Tax=Actinomyces TaxID=1654 RepID=UPI000974F144|nr:MULTISPECIES: ABC transporter ATP-binding protein [Actinomyces]BAW92060.1 ABC transporter component [Actinomyces sp. Chiba101]GAV95007.1 ABC transporter, ATP-binding protein [Actinomyces denticolens]SUU11678.1 Daunorubicin/doxorubicin resistance ATP-binding protein DrrA [Actinomyces denticolens]
MSPSSATDRTAVPVIETIGLTKTFGRGPRATRALDGLDLSVAPGQILGFLGPNGAGKSTTLRVLLGMLRADGGTARLFGADPWGAVAEHERLAYVPGDVALWPGLTGGQTLDALASLRSRRPGGKRRAELIERFDLDPGKKVRAYSKGNRQKVALIAALEADVDLLILDEPTSGLDPLMEEVFRQCVAEAAERGSAVLLSSHILSEVESLADSVTIIRAGRAVESGSLERIRALARSRISAVVEREPDLSGEPGVHDLSTSRADDAWQVGMAVDAERVGAVMERLAALGLRSITAAPPSLEEIFLHHYSADDASPSADGEEG